MLKTPCKESNRKASCHSTYLHRGLSPTKMVWRLANWITLMHSSPNPSFIYLGFGLWLQKSRTEEPQVPFLQASDFPGMIEKERIRRGTDAQESLDLGTLAIANGVRFKTRHRPLLATVSYVGFLLTSKPKVDQLL